MSMTFLEQKGPTCLKLGEAEAVPTLLKTCPIFTSFVWCSLLSRSEIYTVIDKTINGCKSSHRAMTLSHIKETNTSSFNIQYILFDNHLSPQKSLVLVIDRSQMMPWRWWWCVKIHTPKIRCITKVKWLLFSTNALSFLPSTILAYGWGWDGGRALKCRLEVNHSLLVQNGLF